MNKKSKTYHISAKLFEKYQTVVHNERVEECTPNQFYEFLVQTPLEVI